MASVGRHPRDGAPPRRRPSAERPDWAPGGAGPVGGLLDGKDPAGRFLGSSISCIFRYANGSNTSSWLVEAWLSKIRVSTSKSKPPRLQTPPPMPSPSLPPAPPSPPLARFSVTVLRSSRSNDVAPLYTPAPKPSPPLLPAPPAPPMAWFCHRVE